MKAEPAQALARLRGPLYLVAALFLVTPLVDILANVRPLHLSVMQWRFGAAGVASNYLISIAFGSALAAVVAVATGTRITLRLLGIAGGVAALLLVITGVSVVLDMLQLTSQVPQEAQAAFKTGGWKTVFKLITTAVVLAAIATTELRLSARSRSEASAAAPLIVKERGA